jgi:hypothetical protein
MKILFVFIFSVVTVHMRNYENLRRCGLHILVLEYIPHARIHVIYHPCTNAYDTMYALYHNYLEV